MKKVYINPNQKEFNIKLISMLQSSTSQEFDVDPDKGTEGIDEGDAKSIWDDSDAEW